MREVSWHCYQAEGESLQTFSQRTGIPVEKVVKLNANESPYGPVPAALQALREHDQYNQYPDTQAFLLKEALSRYTGLDVLRVNQARWVLPPKAEPDRD